MATSAVPQPSVPKPGNYDSERASFDSINDLFRFFQPKIMKVSKNSPPVLNVDVKEGEHVWDRTLFREYTVSDGVLRYVQYT